MKASAILYSLLLTALVGCGFYQSKINADSSGLMAGPIDPTFQSIHDRIFVPKCIQCHSAGGKAEDAPLDTYDNTMANDEYVVAGDPDDSEIVKEVKKGKMPPKKSGLPPVTPEELEAIRQWITDGAKP